MPTATTKKIKKAVQDFYSVYNEEQMAEVEKLPNGNVLYIWPYKSQSHSAKELSKRFKTTRSATTAIGAAPKLTIINWGCGKDIVGEHGISKLVKVFNAPSAVNICRDKLRFFKTMLKASDPPRIPDFVEDLEAAKKLVEKGVDVFGREKTGSCGLDIVTFEDDPGRFANSDFFSVYKKKKHEFRVHIFRIGNSCEVIDVQQKILRKTDPDTGEPIDKSKVDFKIRNHRNGFIFARNEIEVPEDVKLQAVKAVVASGLDFGAVDVIWNDYEAKAYVLEINTAPGLEGTTIDNYYKYLKQLVA